VRVRRDHGAAQLGDAVGYDYFDAVERLLASAEGFAGRKPADAVLAAVIGLTSGNGAGLARTGSNLNHHARVNDRIAESIHNAAGNRSPSERRGRDLCVSHKGDDDENGADGRQQPHCS
jgi:hypothetical protein